MNSRTDAVARRGGLREFVESRAFQYFVTTVIIINAVTLGLETSPTIVGYTGSLLHVIDSAALWIFTIELLLKLAVYRTRFFRDGWNLFDFTIVTIAWIPSAGPLSVMRALRIMRVLRLVSVVPSMRKVVGALINALPGMGSIVLVLLLVYYIAAVMATSLFGAAFPDWFGNVGASMFSLFQIMTLESWSMGIVRPVMEVYPHAWTFFVPFIVVTSFTVLNLFIALIVNSMHMLNAETSEEIHETADLAHDEREALARKIEELTSEVRKLRNRNNG
ncbi:MAG: ion transporter [Woeseiaceae bacterium]|nr:ion transporter [Woeseiaceae bacterium]